MKRAKEKYTDRLQRAIKAGVTIVTGSDNYLDLEMQQGEAAKLYFTVTKKGVIKNVNLDRTCNLPEINKKMIDLVSYLEGIWIPAKNSESEKVDQELVVSFGLKGC